MPRPIEAKTILSSIKPGSDTWFGLRYNMNLYRGCQHACIYCDSRSTCYQLGDLADIRYKDNALQLLEDELAHKRNKGTIGFGSMNDPYMPIEQKLELTRRALMLIVKYRYPVHIITKSTLVCRDIDLLQEISKIYAAISVTITTIDDKTSKIIEPGAPSSSSRFEAIKKLSDAGIYCGITLMPVLPFITDTPENIENLLIKAKESGASYVLGALAMTLRDGQREYYYNKLDQSYPGIKEKYIRSFGAKYGAYPDNYKELEKVFYKKCKDLGLSTKMKFYTPNEPRQIKLF